jgi:hypothetical protein
MARLLLALLVALAALPALAADEAERYPPPKEMVLLTVGGLIGNTNRGPLDPHKDSLLAAQEASFKNAFAFDRQTLLSLEQGTVTAQPPEFDAPATFKGPLLREVLGHVEAARVKVSFTAVNGYTGRLTPENIDSSDWIVALEVNGAPLGIGQQGAPLADQHARARLQAGRNASCALDLGAVLYACRRRVTEGE